VTLRVASGVPSLRRPRPSDLIEEIFAAEKRRKGFRLIDFAVRSNHLHLICEANDTLALSRGIQRIASRIARAINRLFRRRGKLFTDRFHNRVITTPRDMRNTFAYVLLNEHKDSAARGRTVHGVDPYSSGMHFKGWKNVGALPPDPDERPPPVTEACSWLLSKGWRRCGLIHTQERAPTIDQKVKIQN
jgi:REP element-mobilizing transposase RayT